MLGFLVSQNLVFCVKSCVLSLTSKHLGMSVLFNRCTTSSLKSSENDVDKKDTFCDWMCHGGPWQNANNKRILIFLSKTVASPPFCDFYHITPWTTKWSPLYVANTRLCTGMWFQMHCQMICSYVSFPTDLKMCGLSPELVFMRTVKWPVNTRVQLLASVDSHVGQPSPNKSETFATFLGELAWIFKLDFKLNLDFFVLSFASVSHFEDFVSEFRSLVELCTL